MMKREQILCDRCCREIEGDGLGLSVAIDVTHSSLTVWRRDYEHLCETCKKTLTVMLNKYIAGYSKKRAKLIGGNTPEETE